MPDDFYCLVNILYGLISHSPLFRDFTAMISSLPVFYPSYIGLPSTVLHYNYQAFIFKWNKALRVKDRLEWIPYKFIFRLPEVPVGFQLI